MKTFKSFALVGFAGGASLVALFALTPAVYAHGKEHNPTRADYVATNGVPDEHAEFLNPLRATPAALDAGKTLYADNCAACHGDAGDGDGEAAADLEPTPAALSGMYDPSMVTMSGMGSDGPDTHLMHGVEHHHPGQTHAEAMGGVNLDAYMYWAVSEGGEQMGSDMPAFDEILSEEERWQILLYVANNFSIEPMH